MGEHGIGRARRAGRPVSRTQMRVASALAATGLVLGAGCSSSTGGEVAAGCVEDPTASGCTPTTGSATTPVPPHNAPPDNEPWTGYWSEPLTEGADNCPWANPVMYEVNLYTDKPPTENELTPDPNPDTPGDVTGSISFYQCLAFAGRIQYVVVGTATDGDTIELAGTRRFDDTVEVAEAHLRPPFQDAPLEQTFTVTRDGEPSPNFGNPFMRSWTWCYVYEDEIIGTCPES
jgi:hypothetical protein